MTFLASPLAEKRKSKFLSRALIRIFVRGKQKFCNSAWTQPRDKFRSLIRSPKTENRRRGGFTRARISGFGFLSALGFRPSDLNYGVSPACFKTSSTAVRFHREMSPLDLETARRRLSGSHASHQIEPGSSGKEKSRWPLARS